MVVTVVENLKVQPFLTVTDVTTCYRFVPFLPSLHVLCLNPNRNERWGAGVETQKNVRGEIGGWGRVPFNETYAPSLSTIYDGA